MPLTQSPVDVGNTIASKPIVRNMSILGYILSHYFNSRGPIYNPTTCIYTLTTVVAYTNLKHANIPTEARVANSVSITVEFNPTPLCNC